ncbi:hypothetical protein EW145_g7446 [Phellinidium pouzarii]|uniref:Uncharacterized protein n=1 Tax=Phellinidium pouzarii TaxID=167371 RepID=A0A4S4KIY1_9AGAM|nr:hypothetical protein EW145_g7446 [Phellinidium pouzarii]
MQYRSGAHCDDADQESYYACSTLSSNMTADNLPGAGRILGNVYSFLGRYLKSMAGRAAERLGYGPRVTAIRIQKRHKVIRDASRGHLSWTSCSPEEIKAKVKKVENDCKLILKYVRSNVLSTTKEALEQIVDLSVGDEYIRGLLLVMGAVNTIDPLQRDPFIWINTSLRSSSQKVLLVLGDTEVHTLARKCESNHNRAACLWALLAYLQDPDHSFVAIRYLRQLSISFHLTLKKVVQKIVEAINANFDTVELEECDRILEMWMEWEFKWVPRVDGRSSILEFILRLPRTVNSKELQEWLRDLWTVDIETDKLFDAHYKLAVLLEGFAVANRQGDEDLWATYPHHHPGLQPLLRVLASPPDIALSRFVYKNISVFERRVPGAEGLRIMCNELTIYASRQSDPGTGTALC